MLAWISSALKSCEIAFPEENGPIKWPKHTLFKALRQIPEKDKQMLPADSSSEQFLA
jgi:hypothetical protein